MNRAEARIKNFQNSKTRFVGVDSNIPSWIRNEVVSDEMKFSRNIGRKRKKNKK